MTLIGTPKDPPRREEAEAFLARFVAALEDRRPWFVAEVAARGGQLCTDGSVESLDALLDFVASHLEEQRPTTPPEWFNEGHRGRGWSAYGAALTEGLMGYLAEVYERRTAARWVLDTDRKSAHFHQPVMSIPGLAPPWRQVQGSLIRAKEQGRPGGGLSVAAQTGLSVAEQSPASAANEESVSLKVTVDPVRHPDWNLEATVDEEAEDVLGTERFEHLVHRFQAVDGVKDALHEDREVFLLRTARRTDPKDVERRLQAILDEAVAEAAQERKD